MSSVTWRYLSGDTASFAIELSLVTDDTDDWMVDADEHASWGTFALWVHGVNVCEHMVQGETLHYAHWYLLPIVEWLIEHWDPLLHEERLPVSSAGVNAALGVSRASVLGELHAVSGRGLDMAEAVQLWHRRHNIRAAAPGGILADLYIRRFGDHIEFSTGNEPIAGEDWGATFTRPLQAVRIPVSDVVTALRDAVMSFAEVLRKRVPDSGRYRTLVEQAAALDDPEREIVRFAWLSGAGDHVDAFSQLWREVRAAIPADVRQAFESNETSTSISDGFATLAPPAALLFGSLAPDVSAIDMVALYTSLVAGQSDRQVAGELRGIGDQLLASWPAAGLSPGEQGSVYGEDAWNRLAAHRGAREVDIDKILAELGVAIDYVELRDRSVRAVSMTGVNGTARIVVNRTFRLGTSQPVQRFTLAHELGHLLLDQDRASRMMVASGPWAPLEIEQRANAFAAAFLMPIPLLDAVWASAAATPDEIREMARALTVSFSALVSRLQNVGRIAPEEADALRSEGAD